MTSEALAAVERKIAGELSRRPEYFVTHPAEVVALQALDSAQLEAFAIRRGWRVIRRLGGNQFQFYNDTFARLAAESASRAPVNRPS